VLSPYRKGDFFDIGISKRLVNNTTKGVFNLPHDYSIYNVTDLTPGDHLCCIYETEEEHQSLITQYLSHGLTRNEKVIYIIDAHIAETILGYLREKIDVEPYLTSGQLSILEVSDTYMRDGVFDPDRMVSLLESETKRALEEGYNGLRVTGEMTWVLRELPGSERLIEYEEKLNSFFPTSKCMAICQYDRRRFSSEILLEVIRTHPIVVIGTEVCDNFYYLSPYKILKSEVDEVTLNHWIKNILERKMAEVGLRVSEEKYKVLADLLPQVVFETDINGNITFVNSQAFDIFGYTQEDYDRGLNVIQMLIPEDRVKGRESIQRILKGEEPKGNEYTALRKNGSSFPVIVYTNPIFRDGKPAGLRGIVINITERKQAEEALQDSEEKLKSIFEASPDSIMVTGIDGKVIECNQAAMALRGYSVKEDLIGKNVLDLIAPQDQQRAKSYMMKVSELDFIRNIEIMLLTKDGNEFFGELSVGVIRDSSGRPTAFVGISKDITERKQIEEKLQQSERHFRSLIENATDGIVIFDSDGIIRYASPGVEKFSGYKSEEIIGKSSFDYAHPSELSILANTLANAIKETGVPKPLELSFLHKDGYYRFVEGTATNLLNDPIISGIVINVRDVTESKQAEEDIRLLARFPDENPNAVIRSSKDGIILYANKGSTTLLNHWGCQMGQLLPDFCRETIQSVLSSNSNLDTEIVCGERMFSLTFTSVLEAGYVNIYGVDVTERKQAEEALRESNAQNMALISAFPDILFINRRDGEFLTVHTSHPELLFTPPETFLHRKVEEVMPKPFCDQLMKAFTNALDLEAMQELNYVLPIGGKEKHYEARITPGTNDTVITIVRDITERKQAEEALRESEESFRQLFEESPSGLALVDDQGFIRGVNTSLLKLLDLGQEELIGKNFAEMTEAFALNGEEERTDFKERLADGDPKTELTFIRRDGIKKTVSVQSSLIKTGANIAIILFILIDITERKETEDALRESEQRLRDIIFSTADWVWETDEKGVYTYSSEKGFDLFGSFPENPIGKTPFDFMPSDEANRVATIFSEIAANKAPIKDLENWNITKDGERICLITNGVPILDKEGNLKGYRGVDKDITERKQTEEQLRDSEIKYRTLFNNSVDEISIFDLEGHFLEVNDVAIQRLGYSREELLKMSLIDIDSPDFAGLVSERMEKLIDKGYAFFETAHITKDGRKIPIEISCKIIEYNRMSAVLSISRDITERKKSEEELRESNRHLEEALTDLKKAQSQLVQQERLRALGQLASGIAHDFNNALTPILGYSDILLTIPDMLDDKDMVKKRLQVINTAAMDARDTVNRLREFYRMRGGSEILTSVNLNAVIQQAIQLTQPKWKDQAQVNGVTIGILTDLEETPPVSGTQSELREVLTNLIFNSVDAIPSDGTISLRTWVSGNDVALEISDTGVGMTEETRQRCFEPFFSTKDLSGTGLGLSVVYGIIQRHGGTIEVESEVGKGTTFTIYLPISKEIEHKEEIQEVETSLRPLHVLVVDDEPFIQAVLSEYLTNDGHSFEIASNGQEGLAIFGSSSFDLVITDRAMPDMGGDQLAVAIKQLVPGIPVIMITGFGSLMEAAGEMPMGVDCLLSKPITINDFQKALLKVIGKK
jgi:PAS domain S-box-containing protein